MIKYLDTQLSPGFKALFLNRVIMNISAGFFGLFIPIYIFTLSEENVALTGLYYFIISVSYITFLPITTRMMNKLGMKNSLFVGIGAGIIFFVFITLTEHFNVYYMVILSLIFVVTYKLFYWVPYHTGFAKFSDQKDRSRELALMKATFNFVGIFTPLLAGFIITKFSYMIFFSLGIFIYIFSIFPLLKMPKINEHFTWGYLETWRNLFKKENRESMLAFYADGVESSVGMVVWPIFIFLLLDGNFMAIGFITALITAITIGLELFVGKLSDKVSKKKILHYGTLLYALGWIFRIFIVTAFHIFIVDIYHRITKSLTRTPFEAMTYDIAADNGHYIDEFTVIKEISLQMGRATTYLLLIIFSFYISLQWIFVIAALAAISINLIRPLSSK